MPTAGYGANIEGLTQFTRTLAAAGERFPQEIKDANYDVADKLVMYAKEKASGLSRQQMAAARSLRATKTQNYAAVRMGSARVQYAFGAEFGARKRTRTGRIARGFRLWRGNQFMSWNGGPGYFIHPSIREHGPELINEYMQAVDRIAGEAFPE